jgi:metallo-beta-lactamase class B
LSNHGFADYGLEHIEQLSKVPNGPENPFTVGTSGAQHFMGIVETMLRGRIAPDQEASATASPTLTAASVRKARCC